MPESLYIPVKYPKPDKAGFDEVSKILKVF